MRQQIRRFIKRNSFFRRLVYEVGVGIKIPLRRIFWNFIINFFLQENRSVNYLANFRSTVIAGDRLVLQGSKRGTLSSLVNSPGCYIQAGNGIFIGEGTIWGPNVAIVSANHRLDTVAKAWVSDKPVVIGKDCWIGANASIMPGVEIGDSSIIGAGSVVTKSHTQGNALIAGNPAKFIKSLI